MLSAYIQYSLQGFISGYFFSLKDDTATWSTEKEEAVIMSEHDARKIFDELDELGFAAELVLFKKESREING